jgi:hypothetical protein
VSVLEHVIGERETVPVELGLFLEETRRMHPDGADSFPKRSTSRGCGLSQRAASARPRTGSASDGSRSSTEIASSRRRRPTRLPRRSSGLSATPSPTATSRGESGTAT